MVTLGEVYNVDSFVKERNERMRYEDRGVGAVFANKLVDYVTKVLRGILKNNRRPVPVPVVNRRWCVEAPAEC